MRVAHWILVGFVLAGCGDCSDSDGKSAGFDAGGEDVGNVAPDAANVADDGGGLGPDMTSSSSDTGNGAIDMAGDGPYPTGTVVIPAGNFTMGCDGVDCDDDEAPEHEVTLSEFAIDRTEVSQSDYQVCINGDGCTVPSANFDSVATPDLPVVSVTWAQAAAYCTWAGGRLPTEAEWERACAGASGSTYPWGEDAPGCTLANTSGCGDVPMIVDSLEAGASAEGALHMAGNVWEWTADYYAADAYANHAATDPTGPESGDARVYRGGSSGNGASLARCQNRASTYNPEVGGSGLGFRCVYD